MTPLTKLTTWAGAQLKRLTSLVFPRSSAWATDWGMLPTSRRDYRARVGDGSGSSIVMAVVNWTATAYPEAPLQVVRRQRDGSGQAVPAHPLVQLLERPNPAYSGPLLWSALLCDLLLHGNAYLAKVRARAGGVLQLWWIPQGLITPKWPQDGSVWISHYEYSPNGVPIRLDVTDVVHLRRGLDPLNPRLGRSPLASVMSEVWSDMEAAAFTGSILANMGVPGVVLSPGGDVPMSQADADIAKTTFEQRFGGDNRGRAFVATRGLKVDVVSLSPADMDLKALRRLPEERVTAVFGVPAVVAGLGVGWEHSIYNNVSQAREAAYEEYLIPLQRLINADLSSQLLPDFGDTAGLMIQHDYSQVRVLQEDRDKLYAREAVALRAGATMVNEYRTAIGKPAIPEGNVFYLPATTTVVPQAQLGAAPEPAPAVDAPAGPRALPEAAGVGGAATKQDDSLSTEAQARARHWAEGLAPEGLEGLLVAEPVGAGSGNGSNGHGV